MAKHFTRFAFTAALVVAPALAPAAMAANFGKVVALAGGASDVAVDDARRQVYLTQSVESQVQVYSLARSQFLAPVATDQTPLAAAISRSGSVLYVACYDASALDIIDLNTLTILSRINLPAKPEGVAVAGDERVLISTTGNGTGGAADLLLIYNPNAATSAALTSVAITPSAPAAPTFPPTAGRAFLAKHSQLVASRDGTRIVGVNAPAAGSASVFVYESASGTVPRARIVAGASTAVSISDDGTRIASGSILFDAASLIVLGQHNAANVPYPFTPGGSFTTQTNQGGSFFSTDGANLYSAFNIQPFQSPAVASTVGQLMVNDPDNLLVRLGFFLPEGLAGRIVLSADGANAYALSDSGFAILPLSTIPTSPVAVPASTAAIVTGDPCGVTASTATASVALTNQGKGNFTANAQLLRYSATGGTTVVGPGGIIITVPGGPTATTASNPATAPTTRATPGATPQVSFTFNSAFANVRGTAAPPHDFLIQSPEAINIPNVVRVFENSRDSEARGTIVPMAIGPSTTNPLGDLAYDATRQRVYIANAGLNRIDVYDIQQKAFVAPIKVGQMPSSMALSQDGLTLYVTSSNSEIIHVVDPAKGQVVGAVTFPPVPFNSNAALVIPSVIAPSQGGPVLLSTDGTLWKIVGTTAIERPVSKLIGASAAGIPNRISMPASLASTPAGDYVFMATNSGLAYLYSASADDFIAQRTVLATTQTGYLGPVAAGAGGNYFLMSGVLLNSALAPVNGTTTAGANSAMATVNANQYAVFTPVSATSTTAPSVTMYDSRTGSPAGQVSALEGPLTQLANGRLAVSGRTMAVDASGAAAYAITTSGLSIIPLTPVSAAGRPNFTRAGVVNLASYTSSIAPNSLVSIFGTGLGSTAHPGSTPLPTALGGTCVTLNNAPLPLLLVSPTQINLQIPPALAAGNYSLVVHSLANQSASGAQTIAVSKYAPAVFVDGSGQIALYHADGTLVSVDNPATRDEPLVMYAAGLGVTTGGQVTAGNPSPTTPLAVTAAVQVFFGPTTYSQSPVIVDWSGLLPGYIGVYQLNLRIPGTHMNGDALPVTVRIGNINSPSIGPAVPYVAVH